MVARPRRARRRAVAIQVGTNYANDYSDGKRGTDDPSQAGRTGAARGPGPRVTPRRARAAMAAFAVAGIAGLALAVAVGPELLVVGAASFAAGWLYTGGPRPYGYAGLGEVFVFLFFGLVATVGSTYVQTERITGLSVGAAIPVGLLATALLVVNNLRDIPGDTQVGQADARRAARRPAHARALRAVARGRGRGGAARVRARAAARRARWR